MSIEKEVEYFEMVVLKMRTPQDVILLTYKLNTINYLLTVLSVEIEPHCQGIDEESYLLLRLLIDKGYLLLHKCLENL